MTDAKVLAAICRFAFLSRMDESAAIDDATRIYNRWRQSVLKSVNAQRESPFLLAKTLAEHWRKFGRVPQTGQPVVRAEQDWHIPASLDLGPWLEFRRRSTADEFFALLCLRVLRLAEPVVAAALGVTPGTLRYRLARALKLLGEIQMNPGKINV